MSDELKWIVGIFFAAMAAVGGYVTRDRAVIRQMRDGDDKLHVRVNRVERDFVRKEELRDHWERSEKAIAELRADVKEHARETNSRLDVIISMQSKRE